MKAAERLRAALSNARSRDRGSISTRALRGRSQHLHRRAGGTRRCKELGDRTWLTPGKSAKAREIHVFARRSSMPRPQAAIEHRAGRFSRTTAGLVGDRAQAPGCQVPGVETRSRPETNTNPSRQRIRLNCRGRNRLPGDVRGRDRACPPATRSYQLKTPFTLPEADANQPGSSASDAVDHRARRCK